MPDFSLICDCKMTEVFLYIWPQVSREATFQLPVRLLTTHYAEQLSLFVISVFVLRTFVADLNQLILLTAMFSEVLKSVPMTSSV